MTEYELEHHYSAQNYSDEKGNPVGGWAEGKGFHIDWQNGPLNVDGERLQPNGAFVEYVLKAVQQRIEFYQRSPFACTENAEAIEHIKRAVDSLNKRTSRRKSQGTEGTWDGS